MSIFIYKMISIFIFLLLTLYLVFSRQDNPLGRNMPFRMMVVSAFLACIFDFVATVYLAGETTAQARVWSYITIDLYFVLRLMLLVALSFFVIDFFKLPYRHKSMIVPVVIPAVAIGIGIIVSNWTGSAFTITDAGLYARGPLFPVYSLVGFWLVLWALIMVLNNRASLNKSKWHWSIIYVLLSCSGTVVQLFFPGIFLEHFTIGLAFLLMTFHFPKLDSLSLAGLYDTSALLERYDLLRNNGKLTHAVYCCLPDLTMLEENIGVTAVEGMLTDITEELRALAPQDELFRFKRRGFIFLSRGTTTEEKGSALLARVLALLEQERTVNGYTLHVDAFGSVLAFPVVRRSAVDYLASLQAVDRVWEESHESVINAHLINFKQEDLLLTIKRLLLSDRLADYLMVNYQPIYDVKSRSFPSAEALVRMKVEGIGLISPAEFIPLAEETGAILRIDEFMIDQVASFITRPDFASLGLSSVDVNLSPLEILQKGIAARIIGQLRARGAETSRLHIEILETAGSFSNPVLHENVTMLRTAGIQLSLDDFGSGDSGVHRLLILPFQTIKFDRLFIIRSLEDPRGATLIQGLASLGKALGFKIVMEGADTEEDAKRMIAFGADGIQGYHYSRPLAETDFIAFLRDHHEKTA